MNTTIAETRFLQLAQARHRISDGDLLLFRRRSLISIAGRGTHSHAAKASWWDGELFCLEVREWHGGRAVTLESQVKKFSTRIDVYHTNPANRWPEYDRTRSTTMMRRLAGCDYGYAAVLAAAMLHLPLVRMAVRAATEDDAIDRRPPFCSQACAMTDRIGGGIDPVPHLADRLTEPADLARSPFYEYAFTLVPYSEKSNEKPLHRNRFEQEATEETENSCSVISVCSCSIILHFAACKCLCKCASSVLHRSLHWPADLRAATVAVSTCG